MAYLLICSCAFFTSGLALFSGFGLVTVLMPVFALFFPLPGLLRYELAGSTQEITLLKALVGGLIVICAFLELSDRFSALAFPHAISFWVGCCPAFSAARRETRTLCARHF